MTQISQPLRASVIFSIMCYPPSPPLGGPSRSPLPGPNSPLVSLSRLLASDTAQDHAYGEIAADHLVVIAEEATHNLPGGIETGDSPPFPVQHPGPGVYLQAVQGAVKHRAHSYAVEGWLVQPVGLARAGHRLTAGAPGVYSLVILLGGGGKVLVGEAQPLRQLPQAGRPHHGAIL